MNIVKKDGFVIIITSAKRQTDLNSIEFPPTLISRQVISPKLGERIGGRVVYKML